MTMKRAVLACVGLSVLAAGGVVLSSAAGGESKKKQSYVYELRTYTTTPGRLPDLHKRFRDHTVSLFERHGIKSVAYWTPTDKENTLVYVVAHKSKAAAEKSWAAFFKDAEWKKVFKESRKDGPIVIKVVSQYLNPTDYSPMK